MVPPGPPSQHQTDAAFCFFVAFSGVKSVGVCNVGCTTKPARQQAAGEPRMCGGLLEAAFHHLLLLSSQFPQ